MNKPQSKQLAAIIAMLIVVACLMAVSYKDSGDGFAKAQPIRVACIGDSITEGSGYPAELQRILGDQYKVENFGVSGSTVSLKSNKPYLSQAAFQNAQAFQPSIVVIMLGTNDASTINYAHIEDFSVDYKKIIMQFQNLASTPEVWLAEPPPIFNNTLNLTNENLIEGVIPQIQQVADELSLPTIDIHTPLIEHDDFFGDGVHPSSDGAAFIAIEINNAITIDNAQDQNP